MQPSLFDGDYVPDKRIEGRGKPTIRHPNHRNPNMSKPFIGWDGEGYTDDNGIHHYWLLANSVGDKLIAPIGRSIERASIVRMFHQTRDRIPNAIHVGFALGYDFTMMLRACGLTVTQTNELSSKKYMTDDNYVWRVMMGKQITTWMKHNSAGSRFNLQDVWGFFQRSFIKALDEMFDSDWPYRDTIIEMKAKRSTFDREHDKEVMRYNDMELELLVELMEELRERLFNSGMPISRWYGPGAIASGLMQRWKIKDTLVDLYDHHPQVALASQHAYAGGRFELVKPGHANQTVYQYDINSAYPFAIAQLPNLAKGTWKHHEYPSVAELPRFSVIRLRWNTILDSPSYCFEGDSWTSIFPRSIPFPFWRRSPKGNISYPATGIHGWYWKPEVEAALRYSDSLPVQFGAVPEILEAWSFHEEDENDHPFDAIPVLYENRQKLKAMGNGAHVGIKLGLNSLYGKLAQQIGYDTDKKRKPPYHNLALAGYVTATCRGMMVDAMSQAPESVIAFETDGIFSLAKLDLPVSNRLGEWDETVYDDLWYFQSGMRFGIRDGQVVKPATRGIPAKDMQFDISTGIPTFVNERADPPTRTEILDSRSELVIPQTQFMTLQWALAMNHREWIGNWRENEKHLKLMCEDVQGAKRVHDYDCPECVGPTDHRTYLWGRPHLTIPAMGNEGALSEPHKVEWSTLPKTLSEQYEDTLQQELDIEIHP